jgi:hypothetical protein
MPKPALYFNEVGYVVFPFFFFRALTVQNAEMAVMSLLGSLQSYAPTLRRIIKRLQSYEVPLTLLRSGRGTSLGLPRARLGPSNATRPLDITQLSNLDQGM